MRISYYGRWCLSGIRVYWSLISFILVVNDVHIPIRNTISRDDHYISKIDLVGCVVCSSLFRTNQSVLRSVIFSWVSLTQSVKEVVG